MSLRHVRYTYIERTEPEGLIDTAGWVFCIPGGGTRAAGGAGAELGEGGLDRITDPTKLEGNRPTLPLSEPRIHPSKTRSWGYII